MNINEKCYRKKSPEAIAHEATIAHYLLFYDKDLDYITKHNETQQAIDLELAATAILKMNELEEARKTKTYIF